MTCIVGLQHRDGVTIGGDSAATSGCDQRIRAEGKVFTTGPYLMGFTSSFRMGDILRYGLLTPEPPRRALDRFMATIFVDAVRNALNDGGHLATKEGRAEGGTFLVGVHGVLYSIFSDFQVGRCLNKYDAVGSGGEVAVGSLHTSGRLGELNPTQRVRMALEAAASLNSAVSGPFRIRTQVK